MHFLNMLKYGLLCIYAVFAWRECAVTVWACIRGDVVGMTLNDRILLDASVAVAEASAAAALAADWSSR